MDKLMQLAHVRHGGKGYYVVVGRDAVRGAEAALLLMGLCTDISFLGQNMWRVRFNGAAKAAMIDALAKGHGQSQAPSS